uniref:Tripartite motif containing 66 n=1 Tax=Neogobius melanostomus TaxID=47308 RepID=A0A8C6SV85_9GOBI
MEKSCSQCSEPTLAQSLCTQCNKWLCYQCTDVHQHHTPPAPSRYTDFHPATRPNANQCPELHQRGASSLPTAAQGVGSYPCPLLLCHSHRQEPLELFCESCDLLCCSSCHLSAHKNHRVVPIEKALQDQRWLFESLLVQVEERRSTVENNAKQIEERLHSVKIAHRKAENQIKMAKMIMMNELNKRSNLLIEQLEKFSEDLQQHLEDYLQGAIEVCGQMDHAQKFITWATSHHCSSPLLFSKEMISLQMQQLLEPPLPLDSMGPVRIKFNWDASYWTKQISTLGELTVEGGNCPYTQSLSCPSILHPQPISCLTLHPVCHRSDSSCGYKSCCEPQMCCLHGLPNPDLSMDKTTVDGKLYRSGLGLLSTRHWDTDSLSGPHLPVSSTVSFRPAQAKCTHGTAAHTQPVSSHSLSVPYLHQQQRTEALPDSQVNTEGPAHSQCQRKMSVCTPLQQEDRDVMCKDMCDERCRLDETCGHEVEGTELSDEEQTALQQKQNFQICLVPELGKEQQRTRPVLTTKDIRTGKRSTSLEVPVTGPEFAADVQRSRLSPNPVCGRRERRSQSIPAELVPASSANPYADTLPACPQSLQAPATDKHTPVDSRQRRASDGVLCVVKENSATLPPARIRRSPLLTYKTEADQSCTFVSEGLDFEVNGRCRVSNSVLREAQKDQGRPKVPVVCLERLKILVSQIPPQGRRQSDPLPASASNQEVWDVEDEVGKRCPRTTYSLSTPKQNSNQSSPSSNNGDFNYQGFQKSPSYVAQSYSSQNTDPRTPEDNIIQIDPDCDTDDTDPNVESSSEAELECFTHDKSMGAGEVGEVDRETDITDNGDSDPSLEYEAGSEEEQGRDSREGGSELDQQDHFEEAESQSGSERAQNSQCSIESDVEVDSEGETVNDEPQPLMSDQEGDPHIGPILIANPERQSVAEDVPDRAEMESEDFCAVCLIGGDLLCCDRCPKVYHLSCHIPALLTFPSGDWVCSLCRDMENPEMEYDCENERSTEDHAPTYGLAATDQRKCERLTLLILSNILSAPFHEPVSPLARHYYQIIKRPMDLSVIRTKLNKSNSKHYNSADQYVADVYLMFKNCAKFNYPDSEVAQAGRSLESFFNSKLKDVFSDRVFPGLETDSDSDEYDEMYRSTEGGFPWPERREQCHRKRKRRHSLKSKRQHF